MKFSKFGGISHPIAVAIVTIAAIAGTIALVMNYLLPMAFGVAGSAKFMVTDVHLSSDSFSITIKNVGNVKITHIKIYIGNSKIIDRGVNIDPGGEVTCSIVNKIYRECRGSGTSGSWGINWLPSITPGGRYRISVIVYFQNGESKTWTGKVIASS